MPKAPVLQDQRPKEETTSETSATAGTIGGSADGKALVADVGAVGDKALVGDEVGAEEASVDEDGAANEAVGAYEVVGKSCEQRTK